MTFTTALEVARAYHDGWTSGDFARSAELLHGELVVEVPVNEYEGASEFAEAVRSFGALATHVELLSALGNDEEAVLLYDMEVAGLGRLRLVEHFTVREGQIVQLRQIHDTAALREAGLVPAETA